MPLVHACFDLTDELVDRDEQRRITGQPPMPVDEVSQLRLRLQGVRYWSRGV